MASEKWRDDLREIRGRRSRLYFDARMMDYRNCAGRFDCLVQDEHNSWEVLRCNRTLRSYLDRGLEPATDNKRRHGGDLVAASRGDVKRVPEPGTSYALIKNVAATTLNFPPWPFQESVGDVSTRIKTKADESRLPSPQTASLTAIGLYQTTRRDSKTARKAPVEKPTPRCAIQHLPAVTVFGLRNPERTEPVVRTETAEGRGEKSRSSSAEPRVVPRLEKLLRDWMDSWLYEQVENQLAKLASGARIVESGPSRGSSSDPSSARHQTSGTSAYELNFEEESSVENTSSSTIGSPTDPSPSVREDAESGGGSRTKEEIDPEEADLATDSAHRTADEAEFNAVSDGRSPRDEADSNLRPDDDETDPKGEVAGNEAREDAANELVDPSRGSENDSDDISQSTDLEVGDVADANEEAAVTITGEGPSPGFDVTSVSRAADLSVGEVLASASRGPGPLPKVYLTGAVRHGFGDRGRSTTVPDRRVASAGENSERSRDATSVLGTSASCSTSTYSEGELMAAFVTRAENAPSHPSDRSSRLEEKSLGEI